MNASYICENCKKNLATSDNMEIDQEEEEKKMEVDEQIEPITIKRRGRPTLIHSLEQKKERKSIYNKRYYDKIKNIRNINKTS